MILTFEDNLDLASIASQYEEEILHIVNQNTRRQTKKYKLLALIHQTGKYGLQYANELAEQILANYK